MKFVPKEPDPQRNPNVSREHPLREALTLVVGTILLVGVCSALIALAVDFVVLWIPPETEAKLGWVDWTEDQARADEEAVPIQALVDRLAEGWPENPYRFRVVILDGEAPNAFAFPGGTIGVTRGLLDEVESMNELAFVLGHEIGHFKNRDHLRGLGRGIALSMVLGWLTDGGSNVDLGSLVSQLTARAFDREQEAKADTFGLELQHKAFGHVAGVTRFFERLAEDENGLTRALVPFASHPMSEDRIERIRTLASERGFTRVGELEPWTPLQ